MDIRFANEIERYGMEIDIIRGGQMELMGGKPIYKDESIINVKALITNANKGNKEEWGVIQGTELSNNTVVKLRVSKTNPKLKPNDRFIFDEDEYRIMYERKLQSNFCDFRIYFATMTEVEV